MRYDSGGAFRRALEDRLRTQNSSSGTPLVRLRKTVAFERLLARLVQAQPDRWVLKGGFALQLRLGDKARTTKDIDVLHVGGASDLHDALAGAASLSLDDWFEFEVERPADTSLRRQAGGLRFSINALLDGRPFERFHVDVGLGDPIVEQPDVLAVTNLLGFAGIETTRMPCYPVTQQVAEKVHTYTRPRRSGESSRLKDFVDILALATLGRIEAGVMSGALDATFDAAATHPMPAALANPPRAWVVPFRKMAADLDLGYANLDEGTLAAKGFIDPVLSGQASGAWDARAWRWG